AARPASRHSFGNCVDLPEPVAPQTMTAGWRVRAASISSRCAVIGSAGSYSSLIGSAGWPPRACACIRQILVQCHMTHRHREVPRRRSWRSFGQKPRFLPKAALGRAACPDPAHQLDDAAADLILLDRLEERAEVALAEAFVALALDDLEEDRADHVAGEDLQQQAIAALGVAVDHDPAAAQLLERLAMSRDARIDGFVVGIGRVLERQPAAAQHIDGAVDVIRGERDVLNALAVILPQILLDLALFVLRFVDGNADLPAGTGHRAGEQAGMLALDVEVTDLAEVEQLFVEALPLVHVAALHVVSEMIDARETGILPGRRRNRSEINIVDRALAVPVDQIHERAADALDAGNVELHGTCALRTGLGAELERAAIGVRRILDAKGHRARGRTVLARKLLRERFGLCVDDEVDCALPVQRHVFGAVLCLYREAHPLE